MDRVRNKKNAERGGGERGRMNGGNSEWRKESNPAAAALRQERLFFEVCIAYKCPVVKSKQYSLNESGC